ncbi:MAG: dTDP-4-dehydrorhamnose reductase, partial [Verrucomicrobiae bacterium]|nr:dTDP-4-dehydrorhamnose reductase [Verrucomicrobiae bacterium]
VPPMNGKDTPSPPRADPRHVVVIGANGALGSDLVKVFRDGWRVTGLTPDDLDVRDLESVRRALLAARPDVVINTAAYNRVREAETEADEAYAVNATGAGHVAAVALDLGAVCVHYSTDYVFDGETTRPYTEADPPQPVNIYGASKLAGECAVLESSSRNLVLRTTGLYGETPTVTKGRNFVQTLWQMARGRQEIAISEREICSPTWTLELARQTRVVVEAGASGLFHAVNEGACTWREFAQAVLDLSGERVTVCGQPQAPDPGLVRPRYTALENARLRTLGLNIMKSWRAALEEFLRGEGGARLRMRSGL